tara:strand:+ start:1505 stop:1696 length:192 start_codon:yes stop_codon:yes gene_type:complete
MKLTERQLLHAIDIAKIHVKRGDAHQEEVDYLEAMHEKHYGKFGLQNIKNYIAPNHLFLNHGN